jgi:hypothetical protein
MEGFNVEHDFAVFVVSFATVSHESRRHLAITLTNKLFQLARGNPYIGRISIVHEASDIPPPPNKIDGPTAGGIAKHGRFEGTFLANSAL